MINPASGTMTSFAAGTGLLGGTISNGGTVSVDVGTGANQIMRLTAASQIPAVDGFLVTNLNVIKIQGNAVAATAPSAGTYLGWNTTTSQWQPMAPATSGTVTNVTSGTGLVAGTISSNGTINVDVGTTASKIVQLTASAQLPGVDGALLTNLNASRIGTQPVATTAPGAGQFLGWNATTARWEPLANPASGTMTSFADRKSVV